MPRRIPSYRLHKPTGQAFIELKGHRFYLGKHGTPESRRRYASRLAEHLATRVAPIIEAPRRPITIDELIREFWEHVKQRYVKNGRPTSERNRFKIALRAVRRLYGATPAAEFGPLRLMAVRKTFVDRHYVRRQINLLIGRIRRCWKWGVSRELVPETVWRALTSIEGLRKGEGVDRPPVRPVTVEHVQAVKAHLSPVTFAMIEVQLLTGCRPGEVCSMRMRNVSMKGEIWEYRPGSHKTEHHGIERVIFIGPKAQEIIRPFLKADPDAPLFRPGESREWHLAKIRKKSRRKVRAPRRIPGEVYTANSYGQAIRKACDLAKVPRWTPNRLRHSAATLIRQLYGLEASRVVLGHTTPATTEIYAELDQSKAREVMRAIG